jgi:hypothetical protein
LKDAEDRLLAEKEAQLRALRDRLAEKRNKRVKDLVNGSTGLSRREAEKRADEEMKAELEVFLSYWVFHWYEKFLGISGGITSTR